MNKLINRLWINDGLDLTKSDFTKAIHTACQAQRNACLRVCEEFDLPQNNFDRMATAEITEQDYE